MTRVPKEITGSTWWTSLPGGWAGILGAILILGLFLRVMYLRELRHAPDFAMPLIDAGFHDYWARALAFGNWIPPHDQADPLLRTTPFFRPPLYPYFLSLIYRLAGPGYLAPRLFQMLIGLINCLLAFIIARRWIGLRSGLISAALMATYWALIYYEGELHEPTVHIFLLLISTYCLCRFVETHPSGAEKLQWPFALAAGFLLGLCALTRPNTMLLIPAALCWMGWIAYRLKAWPRFYISAAALILAAAVAIAPVTIRNYTVAHDLVLISTNGGINLYIGNNEHADGLVANNIAGIGAFETCFDWPGIVRSVGAKLHQPEIKHSEASAYLGAQARKFIFSHPWRFFILTVKKAFLFWGPEEVTHNKADKYERKFSRVLNLVPGNFPFIASMAAMAVIVFILGLIRPARSRPQKTAGPPEPRALLLLLILFVFIYFVSVLPFFAAGRYRIPIIPFMIIIGSFGVDEIIKLVEAGENIKAGVRVGLWIVLFGIFSIPFVPERKELNLSKWYYDRGVAFDFGGKTDDAMREYRAALEVNPDSLNAHLSLGAKLAELGKFEEALSHMSEALRIDPNSADAFFNMGAAYLHHGDYEQAVKYLLDVLRLDPGYANAMLDLGYAYFQVNKPELATPYLEQALALKPDSAMAHNLIGINLIKEKKIGEGVQHFLAAVKIDPDYVDALNNLGFTYYHIGQYNEAIAALARSIMINPNDANPRYYLALSYLKVGNRNGAAEQYEALKSLDKGRARELETRLNP